MRLPAMPQKLFSWAFSFGQALLARATGQGEGQAQHAFAGNRLHKQSAEAGRNAFAARVRSPCKARWSQQGLIDGRGVNAKLRICT